MDSCRRRVPLTAGVQPKGGSRFIALPDAARRDLPRPRLALASRSDSRGGLRRVLANLRNLRLDALDVVNLRMMFDQHRPAEGSIEPALVVLAELQQRGLVRHIGLSNVTRSQISAGRRICKIVCVPPMQVALAWLLQRAENILLIPGTSSRTHLRENLVAAALALTVNTVDTADAMGGSMESR